MKAVILDLDGVIVDSEHQWGLAEGAMMRRLVGKWTRADHYKFVGVSPDKVYPRLRREYGLRATKEDFLAQCDALARRVYTQRASLTPGAKAFLREMRRRRVPLALASSSPRSWVELALSRFRLHGAFAAVVTGDDAPGRAKPAPDIYLLAAKRLGVKPKDCLAIEDSAIGVRAAKAAGMRCVGLRTGLNDEQDLSGANWEVKGFKGLCRLQA